MNKDIKDYLPFYLGCQFRYRYIDYQSDQWVVWLTLTPERLYKILNDHSIAEIQLALRPLSDMTEEYFLSLFKIATGCYDDMNVTEFKRHSTSDLYVRLGYGQFIFGFWKHPKPDVRVEEGISLYIKEYLIEDRLELTDNGLTETQSHFNREKLAVAFNQSVIFNKLRKDSFDVDGLIESGLAIDKTTLKISA